ncbi:MAG: DNA-directed RNA polymerase subunit M [Sulfolobales archaeon]
MFCPRCGGLMVPQTVGGKKIFKCTKCGYEIEASHDAVQSYATTSRISAETKVKTSKVSESSSKISRSLEEIEQEKEEFYEIFLDLAGEEGEEKESSEE